MMRFFIFFMFIFLAACNQSTEQQQSSHIQLTSRMGATPDPGFTRALEPREFVFPEDHGAHPDFATEWWYFTGNLISDKGARLGYQLTLFRIGLKPGKAEQDSNWRSHQLYMGHLAVSDIANRKHISEEKFSRAAAGLAGATAHPHNIWLGPWSIKGDTANTFPLKLNAEGDQIAIDLTVSAGTRPHVLQGDNGLSRKGAGEGNSSYYYSYTRLPTSGSIHIKDKIFQVAGNSWFDREWSSSALAEDQAGWDWFSLQLEDGQDLMFYQLRDHNGQAQNFSSGVLVKNDGQVEKLNLQNTQLKVLDVWRNDDGIEYPLKWQLKIPQQQIDLTIEAAFEDQEMKHTVRYWEGAVNVSGSHAGVGYLELSGYAK